MPVEIGEVFFFCMGYDQAKETEQRMIDHAREKQRELIESLKR